MPRVRQPRASDGDAVTPLNVRSVLLLKAPNGQEILASCTEEEALHKTFVSASRHINRRIAQQLINHTFTCLENAGIPVFVKSLSRPSGKVYYSLFLGRFKSYSEAQRQFESFKKLEASRPFKDAFIRTLSE